MLDRIFEKLHFCLRFCVIGGRILFRISDKRTLHPLEENEAIF